jgi:hypothetical protein
MFFINPYTIEGKFLKYFHNEICMGLSYMINPRWSNFPALCELKIKYSHVLDNVLEWVHCHARTKQSCVLLNVEGFWFPQMLKIHVMYLLISGSVSRTSVLWSESCYQSFRLSSIPILIFIAKLQKKLANSQKLLKYIISPYAKV